MPFKRLAAFALAACALALAVPASAVDITGAGATFPYPIYAKWAEAYKAKTGVGMNYQSIGSGGGIKQIQAKTVDFGASDMPLKPDELDKDGLMQFPDGDRRRRAGRQHRRASSPGELKLTGAVLADIYLGKITEVERPGDRRAQPGRQAARRGHRRGAPLRRLRHHLHLHQLPVEGQPGVEGARSARARRSPGRTGVGGKGNEGVAAYVQRIKGSIGYVEYAYAKQNKMTYAQLQNKDGNFVSPDDDAFKAAAAGADWSKAPGSTRC